MSHFLVTGAQIRMGRAGARLSVRELAEAAKIAPNTVTRVEGDQGVNTSTLTLLQQALERAGIEFGADGSVKLRRE